MQTIDVEQGQSLFDVIVVGRGDITSALKFALANNRSLTGAVQTGDVLELSGKRRKAIIKLFEGENKPATAITQEAGAGSMLDYVFPYILPISL